jgi:Leucine-rich repeat (LRR) protein
MKCLTGLKTLEVLRLGTSEADAESLSTISDLQMLRLLEVSGMKKGAGVLSPLRHLSNLKQLERLYLGGLAFRAHDDDVVHLRPLTRLTHLQLRQSEISEKGLAYLGVLHRLKSLDIGWTSPFGKTGSEALTRDGMKAIAKLTQLQVLSLAGGEFSESAFSHVSRLQHLRRLDLHATNVLDDDLTHLSQLKELRHVDLGNTGVESLPLPQLPQLQSLSLEGVSLKCLAPSGLAASHNLRQLSLFNASLDDDSWRAIGELRQLRHLDLRHSNLTNQQLAYFEGLDNLTSLLLNGVDVNDDGIAHLLSLDRLRIIGVDPSTKRRLSMWSQLRNRGVVVICQ